MGGPRSTKSCDELDGVELERCQVRGHGAVRGGQSHACNLERRKRREPQEREATWARVLLRLPLPPAPLHEPPRAGAGKMLRYTQRGPV